MTVNSKSEQNRESSQKRRRFSFGDGEGNQIKTYNHFQFLFPKGRPRCGKYVLDIEG